jgi:c-di-GMP-binding flagellar brake protein YcgR
MSTGGSTADRGEARFSQEEFAFLILAPAEIAQLLRDAMRHEAMFTAYFDESGEFAVTSIVEVDTERGELVFEAPREPSLAARITASARIMLVAYQDGIKLKFELRGASLRGSGGSTVLASPLPAALLRLQRREFFRVRCPLANPGRCEIRYTAEGKLHTVELSVVDLSLGGVALTIQHPTLELEPGRRFAECSITLPGVGSFVTGLEVLNAYQFRLRNGALSMRSGCRFINLALNAQAMLQKYIMQLERAARFGTR